MSVQSVFAELVTNKVLKILDKHNFKEIIMPFEAQPFQKYIISNVKKNSKKSKIVSYINGIQPFPIHLHDNKNIADINFSISETQIYQLSKIFKWKKNKLKLIKSKKLSKKKNK